MAAAKGKNKSNEVLDRVQELEFNQDKIIIPAIEDFKDFIKQAQGGLKLLTLLDNRLASVFVIGLVGAVIWFIATRGGSGT